MNKPTLFVDLGFSQCQKHRENICGDAFKFTKLPEEERVLAVLSDGLGSGVKANILANMTASMALRFIAENTEIIRTAEIIMSALPICQVRKISYATFTIVDTVLNGRTRIIEMGNPPFLLVRNGQGVEIEARKVESPNWKERAINVYEFEALPNDRLVFFSDGISQAGMGTDKFPLGWRIKGCLEYIEDVVKQNSAMSAHELANAVVREALRKEPGYLAEDDMTCAVIYFRNPKKMLLFTGPPFDRTHDAECAEMLNSFEGDKVICGGTTAEIIGRELGRTITMDLSSMVGSDLPPISTMEGVNLITEGIFTLTKTAQYLENGTGGKINNAAGRLVEILMNNDIIELVVGTRINEAHQDPNLPVDLEIRRNIVKRIAKVLRKKYLKEVNIKYV